jgi:hypothetical protein
MAKSSRQVAREVNQILSGKTRRGKGKRWTVEPGRSLYRDGKPAIQIVRDPVSMQSMNYQLSPHEVDVLTHRICSMLNRGK